MLELMRLATILIGLRELEKAYLNLDSAKWEIVIQ
jgi:hypothetical protein